MAVFYGDVDSSRRPASAGASVGELAKPRTVNHCIARLKTLIIAHNPPIYDNTLNSYFRTLHELRYLWCNWYCRWCFMTDGDILACWSYKMLTNYLANVVNSCVVYYKLLLGNIKWFRFMNHRQCVANPGSTMQVEKFGKILHVVEKTQN